LGREGVRYCDREIGEWWSRSFYRDFFSLSENSSPIDTFGLNCSALFLRLAVTGRLRLAVIIFLMTFGLINCYEECVSASGLTFGDL
jgi:hypothetical protein